MFIIVAKLFLTERGNTHRATSPWTLLVSHGNLKIQEFDDRNAIARLKKVRIHLRLIVFHHH